MACATICLLLLEQSKPFSVSTVNNDYASCTRSMRCRYLKRVFIIGNDRCFVASSFDTRIVTGHWLPTLSKVQLEDIQVNHERYVGDLEDD